jgi:hypothetical protein
MARTIRILPVIHSVTGDQLYSIRRVDGSVLIHIGDVWRDGREWVARKHGTLIITAHRTRRDAVAHLDRTAPVLPV